MFRTFYVVYKQFFRFLTGRKIDFGNFCLLPHKLLGPVVHTSHIWNHLAAALIRSRLPLTRLALARGVRYSGQPNMSFISLVVLGLSAISVFSEMMFVRIIVGASILAAATVLVGALLVIVRLATDWTPPGWTSTILASLAVMLLQTLILSVAAILLNLHGRTAPSIIPAKVAQDYVVAHETIYGTDAQA